MTDTQAITVRLPQDVYEALRREAFEGRTSQAAIITEAVQERLGLRPKGDRFAPRMPLSKSDFEIVMSVLTRVLETVRPATPEEAREIRATHHYAYRAGEWAELVGTQDDPETGRRCYAVKFGDGKTDWWPVNDEAAGYEFR